MFLILALYCRKRPRSEEHTSELQSLTNLVCRLLLEKKKKKNQRTKYDKVQTTSIKRTRKRTKESRRTMAKGKGDEESI